MGRLNSTIINGSLNVNGKVFITNDVNISGTTFLKNQIVIDSTESTSWNEGIRINKSNTGWTSIVMGATRGTTSGTEATAWSIHSDPNNHWGVVQGGSDFPTLGLSITNGNTDIRFKNKSLWRDGVAGGMLSSPLITASLAGDGDVSTGGYAQLEIRSNGTTAAYMTFHRTSNFAVNFGLNKNNALAIGGISAGAQMKKIWIEGDLITNAVWNDYAELFKKHKPDVTYKPNHIIELEPDTNTYCYSSSPNSKKIVGVVSDNYGFLLGGDKDVSNEDNLTNYIPIGLAGRLKVYITGEIEIGDLITSSDIEGVGIKSIENIPGTIVGKSLQNKTTNEIGLIEILIMNR